MLTAGLFAYLMLSQRVVQPLLHMAQSISQWDDARVAIQQIGELVNRPQEDGRSRRGARLPVHGAVQFHNVTFTYQGASSRALKDVSFEVPPGTTLGLVGRSGSGKTTVTRLLQRFHPNYDGLIKVDGVDLRDCVPADLAA
jgi:ATP-binding cassette, subfamily B, bacterial HlyB/CyaB